MGSKLLSVAITTVNLVLFLSMTSISIMLNASLFYNLGGYVQMPFSVAEINIGMAIIVSLGVVLDILKSTSPMSCNYLLGKGDKNGAAKFYSMGRKLTVLSVVATTISFALMSQNIAKTDTSEQAKSIQQQVDRQKETVGRKKQSYNEWVTKNKNAKEKGLPSYDSKVDAADKELTKAEEDLKALEDQLASPSIAKKEGIDKVLASMPFGLAMGFFVAMLLELGIKNTAHTLSSNKGNTDMGLFDFWRKKDKSTDKIRQDDKQDETCRIAVEERKATSVVDESTDKLPVKKRQVNTRRKQAKKLVEKMTTEQLIDKLRNGDFDKISISSIHKSTGASKEKIRAAFAVMIANGEMEKSSSTSYNLVGKKKENVVYLTSVN